MVEAGPSGRTGTSRCRRRSRDARDGRVRRVPAGDQPRGAGPDPRRRRRDDLLAPHHPPLRAGAGPDRGRARARGPAGALEREDEGVPRRRRAGRRTRRPPGRALVGRRDRLLPDVRARQRDLAADLAARARPSPTSTSSIAAGDLQTLAAWLRDNLYSLGRKLTPKETLERVTGDGRIDPEPYLAYLRDKQAMLVP